MNKTTPVPTRYELQCNKCGARIDKPSPQFIPCKIHRCLGTLVYTGRRV